MPPRVLVISNLYPDERQPAFGTFMRTHVDALRRAGADVELAAIRGVGVHSAVANKYARLWFTAFGKVVSGLLHLRAPQVVEAHIAYPTGVIAWPLARIARAHLVLYSHGSDVRQVGKRSKLHYRVARFILKRADIVVANSQFIRGVLITDYGLPDDRVIVRSPGIDAGLFREQRNVPREPRRVLYVGRLDAGKGVDVLIEAMASLGSASAELRIVGGGPLQAKLEALAHRRGVAVAFTGPMRPPEVASEMATAGVLVMPSVNEEGLGLVALEAMASGALVVASRGGGLTETVEDGRTGWLVEPGDPSALAAAVRSALDVAAGDDERARSMRDQARERASEHDVDEIARRTVASYLKLTNEPTEEIGP